MSFRSAHVQELQVEEKRCLDKIERKVASLMLADPRLSYASAYGLAVQSMPRLYANYRACREELNTLGVRPQLPKNLSRG